MHRDHRMSNLQLATPTDAMDEERRDSSAPGRRATDGGEIVRAADNAISMGWRWAQILATIIGFGFMAGTFYVQSGATEKAITDLRGDIKDLREENKQFREGAAAVTLQSSLLAQQVATASRDLADVKESVRQLREQMDTMRNMREAYVYAQAGRSKMSATVPP